MVCYMISGDGFAANDLENERDMYGSKEPAAFGKQLVPFLRLLIPIIVMGIWHLL